MSRPFDEGSSLVPEQNPPAAASVDAASLLPLLGVVGVFFFPCSLKLQHLLQRGSGQRAALLAPLLDALLFLSSGFFLPVVTKEGVYVLDMAAKIDATADYICKAKWGDVEFPPPFGREAYPEVRGQGSNRNRLVTFFMTSYFKWECNKKTQ